MTARPNPTSGARTRCCPSSEDLERYACHHRTGPIAFMLVLAPLGATTTAIATGHVIIGTAGAAVGGVRVVIASLPLGKLVPMSDEWIFDFQRPCGCLAHYTTAAKALLGILPTRSLRLGTYRYMRDPTESKDFLPDMRWDGFQPGRDDHDAIWENIVSKLLEARKNARVLSMTTETDEATRDADPSVFDCAWFRPRMWEQYADRHQGVCLLFNEAALVREARRQVSEIHIGRVQYSKRGVAGIPMLYDESLFVADEAAQDTALLRFLRQHVADYFFRKLSDFEAEAEMRMVALPGATIGMLKSANPNAYISYGNALAAVVLGHGFPNDYYAAAVAAATEARVPLYRIEWSDGRPRLYKTLLPPSIHAITRPPNVRPA